MKMHTNGIRHRFFADTVSSRHRFFVRFWSGALLAVVLSGCGLPPRVPMSGQTVASDPLKADVLRILEPFMQGRTGCTERLERIETEVVGREGEWRIDDRDQVVAGTIVEIWTAHMCGRSARFVVKFTPDGLGGTFITVQPEEKASSVKTQEAVPPVP